MKAQSDKPIVSDLVPLDRYPALYPIGRLDADTTGLLLFSTDGELGHSLLHPSRHVSKTYDARVQGAISNRDADQLRHGIELDDGPTQPCELEFVGSSRSHVLITIHEGRYHQVKRMFEAIGHPVTKLHRSQFGTLALGNLKPGSWRILSQKEVDALRNASQ